jgi:hypothetical protein
MPRKCLDASRGCQDSWAPVSGSHGQAWTRRWSTGSDLELHGSEDLVRQLTIRTGRWKHPTPARMSSVFIRGTELVPTDALIGDRRDPKIRRRTTAPPIGKRRRCIGVDPSLLNITKGSALEIPRTTDH